MYDVRRKIVLKSGIVIDVERDPDVGHLHNTYISSG